MAGTCAPAAWSTHRDIAAARVSWERARQIADALPDDDPGRTAMRIAPRTMLCGTGWRVDAHIAGHFQELRELCAHAGDKASLALGMTGMVMEHMMHGRVREASRLASEQMALLESIGDPGPDRWGGVHGDPDEVPGRGDRPTYLRWSQTVIDWADGDPTKGNLVVGSPLAVALVWRGVARYWLGRDGWRQDLDDAVAMARNSDPATHALVVFWKYGSGYATGCSSPTTPRCANSRRRCRSPNDRATIPRSALPSTCWVSRCAQRDGAADHQRGLELLAQVRDMCLHGRFYRAANCRASRLLTRWRGPGAATSMVPYR